MIEILVGLLAVGLLVWIVAGLGSSMDLIENGSDYSRRTRARLILLSAGLWAAVLAAALVAAWYLGDLILNEWNWL